MANIYKGTLGLIGNTPLIEAVNLEKAYNLEAKLLFKLEYFNPAGSVKDRAALQMITEAEENGTLKPGSAIIEPTSGNTGIGLAAIAASRGYRAIFVMPETMSIERRKLLKGYGAEIVLTEGAKGMKGAIAKAKEYIVTEKIGKVRVNYRLRDAIFSRQRYWGEPFPVYYKEGMPYMLDESKLPLELPEVDKY